MAILDEGIGFNPPSGLDNVVLVAEECGLPAAADDDRQDLDAPPGVEVTWLPRADPAETPDRAALAEARALALPDEPFYGWTVGEQGLTSGVRRHRIQAGVPKANVMFCGYWRHRAAH